MRVLVIEKAAVKQNIRVVKRRAGGAAVYGVLSGDAGGAGIAEMAELLRAEGIGPLRRQRGGGGRGAAEGRLCGRGDPHAPLHHRPGGAGAAGGPERGVHHLLRGHGPGPQRPGGEPLHRGRGPHPGGHRHGLRRLPGGGAGEDPAGPTAPCPTWPCPAFTPRSTPPQPARRRSTSSSSSSGCWTPSTPPALRPAPSTPRGPTP